ncbi:hypothetical protein [Nocardioides convexus]|uniref:hypothetical protein n=1 Tax=Nocardioides convexus TaxID=2712224 RepID=UPI00241846C9|nr:hypothetical protein [Nocardioides convexus]
MIADFTMGAVGPAADAVGSPWWTVHPSPCAIEGRSGPPSYLGGWRPGQTPLGRARDAAGRRWVRAFKRVAPRLAGVRLSDVGLTRIYRDDGSEAIYSAERVLALTPGAVEYERDLPPAVRYVGPVLFTPPVEAAPPDLDPALRHVLVTAGTHLPWHKQALLDAAGQAARSLPDDVRVHVSLGSAVAVAPPPGVVVHDYVELCPRPAPLRRRRPPRRGRCARPHAGGGAAGGGVAGGLRPVRPRGAPRGRRRGDPAAAR